MENVFPPADPLCPGNPRPMIPAPENNNSSNYCRCAPRPGNFFPSIPLLPTAFRVIHRASEYALHLPGRAFVLLGVLLEGSLANRHNIPPPRALPLQVSNRPQIDLRPLFVTDTTPTSPSGVSSRGEEVFWPVFGTGTMPTGTSVPFPRGEGGLLTGLWHGTSGYR